MLIVTVELLSALTGKRGKLGQLHIANVGGTRTRGNYHGKAYRKGVEPPLGMQAEGVIREGRVKGYGRVAEPVWELVSSMLQDMGYRGGRGATALPPNDPYVTALREALQLALNRLAPLEPPDSRAVSDGFVAMSAVQCGLVSQEVLNCLRKELGESVERLPEGPSDQVSVDRSLLEAACREIRQWKVDKGGDDQVVLNLEATLRG
jgi:hypothetical protein